MNEEIDWLNRSRYKAHLAITACRMMIGFTDYDELYLGYLTAFKKC